MKTCLIVNDDGYQAAGIRAFQREISQYYDAKAIAPAQEQSWMGKSITGHQPLTLTPVEYHEFNGYMVDGKPADCTQLGLYELYEQLPDFVVSGINQGANIGHAHIMSSGTVGAAFEAAFQGVPAFASSMWKSYRGNPGIDFHDQEAVEVFAVAATITWQIIDKVMAAGFPVSAQVIAINMAYDVKPDAQWFITKPHSISYGQLFQLEDGKYHNTASAELEGHEEPATDLEAVAKGYVSIVPISLQLTSEAGQQELSSILDVPIFGN